MNWNDYEAAWKRQPAPLGLAADLQVLRDSYETKRRKLAATLLIRDWAESVAGLLVAAFIAFLWWHMGDKGWPLVFALGLILGLTVFFLRERLRARHGRLGPEATVLAKVEADLAELRHQHRLLSNIGRWYLAPCAAAILIVTATALRMIPPGLMPRLWEHPQVLLWFMLYFVVILPLCFWGIWAANRRVVRKNIEPRIAELEKLRTGLAG